MEDREYVEVKERVAERLLAIPGAHTVGVGEKLTGGEPTGETAIQVYVARKRPLAEIPPGERVPPAIEGARTDVVEEPPPRELQIPGISAGTEREDNGEYRPVRGGTQVKRPFGGTGTLGCICDVTGDPRRVIGLSNRHVFYEPSDTPANEPVGQPSGDDSSSESCNDIIGTILDTQYDEDVDIALIRLNAGTRYLAEIRGVGIVPGSGAHPALNDQVKKRGRSSELTGGFVANPNADGVILRPDGTVKRAYKRALLIRPNPDPANPGPTDFAIEGDSGSALLNAANRVVGIVFAGGSGVGSARAMPIETIVKKFTGVSLGPTSPVLPAARHVALAVASATAADDVRTVPAAMAADERPARAAITPGEARRLEEELRAASPRGAWYADLYRRHGEEVAALVHKNRRVTVVWHRSGAAELSQWLVRAFSRSDVRVPEEIQGRPVRACLDDLADALVRNGSSALGADLEKALPTLPDVAGLCDREIVERLKLETA